MRSQMSMRRSDVRVLPSSLTCPGLASLSPHPGWSAGAAQSKLADLQTDLANRGTAMSDGWGAAPSRSVGTPTKGQQGKGGKGTGSHKGGGGGG